MKITAIKTEAVTPKLMSLREFVDNYVPRTAERTVVAISSKVVALLEGRVVKAGTVDVQELARREAEYYMAPSDASMGYTLTVNRNILVSKAGIDESNGGGYYVLWPEDPQRSANEVRAQLRERDGQAVGVIITDGRITPMRRGVIGLGLAHSGFASLRGYVGEPDIFGDYELKYTYASILDGLAAAAVVEMGEGAQQTPIALCEDLGFVEFVDRDPSEEELGLLRIPLNEDIYGPMLKAVPWEKRPEKA